MAHSAHDLSIHWMREEMGWIITSVEQTVRYPDKLHPGKWLVFKRDLWGIADYLAIDPRGVTSGSIYIQITTGMNNKGERQQKIQDSPFSVPLLKCGNQIELHIWRKLGARGERKLWKLARYRARLAYNQAAIVWDEYSDSSTPGADLLPVGIGF